MPPRPSHPEGPALFLGCIPRPRSPLLPCPQRTLRALEGLTTSVEPPWRPGQSPLHAALSPPAWLPCCPALPFPSPAPQDSPLAIALFVKYVPLTMDTQLLRSTLTGKVSPAVREQGGGLSLFCCALWYRLDGTLPAITPIASKKTAQ